MTNLESSWGKDLDHPGGEREKLEENEEEEEGKKNKRNFKFQIANFKGAGRNV